MQAIRTNKLVKSSLSRLLYIICSTTAVILFAIIFSTMHTSIVYPAHATDKSFSVTVPDSLNVTISSSTGNNLVSLNLNPATSNFATEDLTVSVGTNNQAGYTLTMTSNSTDLTRTEAVGNTYPTIAALESEKGENEFTMNRWGYRFIDNTTNTKYQPYTVDNATNGLLFNSSLVAVNPSESARTMRIGAKVNTEQAPGTYELALNFTAVPRTITYDLIYNTGTTSTVSNMPANQSGASRPDSPTMAREQ